MKKSIINKNYSLLILILLILYITYINLPQNKINVQTGGEYIDPNSPFFGMDDNKLSKILARNSTLYSILNNYYWIYILINIALIGIAAFYAYMQYQVQGVPLAGIEPGISWDLEGLHFLNFYYLTAKQKYNLFTPGNSPGIKSEVLDKFEDDLDKFVETKDKNGRVLKDAIDTFCNIITPCKLCNCSGPDPNYAGVPLQTPAGPLSLAPPERYAPNTVCAPKPAKNDGSKDPTDSTRAVIKMQKKRGIQDLVFGRIPDCCCHLWKSLFGDSENFTQAKLNALLLSVTKDDPRTSTNFGIPAAAGCEPANASNPATLSGDTGTAKAHVVNGVNIYRFNMIKSCLIKSGLLLKENQANYDITTTPVKIPTITSLTPKFTACATYNTDLDEGISVNYVLRHPERYSGPSSSRIPELSTVALDKVKKDTWTSGIWTETSGVEPDTSSIKPSDWPNIEPFTLPKRTEAPFTRTKLLNNYWYTASSNIKYQLKINTRLYEVVAYPVKAIDTEIYTDELTNPIAITFLNSYLSPIKGNIFVFGGEYYFP